MLGTSDMTLYRAIAAGEFPAVRIRGRHQPRSPQRGDPPPDAGAHGAEEARHVKLNLAEYSLGVLRVGRTHERLPLRNHLVRHEGECCAALQVEHPFFTVHQALKVRRRALHAAHGVGPRALLRLTGRRTLPDPPFG
jgi:hypothetical protein